MRMRSMTWLWVLLAVYAFVVVAMFLAQRSLIYPAAVIAPQLADQALPALRAIETEPEPGLRLTHWYHPPARSVEHTSDLQSLMRTSYAVLCLKKKKHRLYSTNH